MTLTITVEVERNDASHASFGLRDKAQQWRGVAEELDAHSHTHSMADALRKQAEAATRVADAIDEQLEA
jgi:hypothetical protein